MYRYQVWKLEPSSIAAIDLLHALKKKFSEDKVRGNNSVRKHNLALG